MNPRIACCALFTLVAVCRTAAASDPMGIYAYVERVALEPNDKEPERIQVWGVFLLADLKTREYLPPKRGYMVFSAVPDKAELCRREWADLKRMARSGDCAAFGSRYQKLGSVHEASEKPATPDKYPLADGVVKLRPDPEKHMSIGPLVEAMRQLPVPQTPADGAAVEAGKVKLVTRGIGDRQHADAKYVFEIEHRGGEKEQSTPVALADKLAHWTPSMHVQPGEVYTWRVWAADGEWKSPVVESLLRGKESQ